MKKSDRGSWKFWKRLTHRVAHSGGDAVECRFEEGAPVCAGPGSGSAGDRADDPAEMIDPFPEKVEEWVDRSKGDVRARQGA